MSAPASKPQLGPYEPIEPVGKGGMGEVWRARDPRLGRDVAIKISAQQFTDRFEREARAIAALNHPNICTLYDVGPNYLVMELIEGPTLAERIAEGPIPLEETLRIAMQIAAALEAAHEKGIVHRDLKPANVKLKPDGSVKVLDFGLAKSAIDTGGMTADSPTMLSAVGMIVGTAGYMAPEQARGKAIDKRADIWAFGVVLYEMLTGKQLFAGEDVVTTLAAVVHKEPDLSAAPPRMRRLLQRCLTKDPNQRLRDISGVELLLEDSPSTAAASLAPGRIAWMAALIAIVIAAALEFVNFRQNRQVVQTLRSTIAVPEGTIHSFALSPDGRTLVIAAESNGKRQLWLRPMDALQAQPIAFTDAATYPFWSPDGLWIAFFADDKLKKIAVTGGAAQSICDAREARGGSWNSDGVIVMSVETRLSRVTSSGGLPVNLTDSRAEERNPFFLPDGQHFLYVLRNGPAASNGVRVRSLDGKYDQPLVPDVSSAIYAPPAATGGTGQILFARGQTLMGLPYDARNLQATGDAIPLADDVGLANVTWLPVSTSNTDLLVYLGGFANNVQVGSFDRSGKPLGTVGDPGRIHVLSLSPDEKAVAFERQPNGGYRANVYGPATDIWIRDLLRGTETRLTTGGTTGIPIWSPRGDRILFVETGAGVPDMFQKVVAGNGQPEEVFRNARLKLPNQWTHDGQYVVYSDRDPKTRFDLWVLPMQGAAKGKPVLFLNTEFDEEQGQLSPDNKWMAFASNRSGLPEIYIRPFPQGEGEWTVSVTGGAQPRWRADGKELYFVGEDLKMMAASVKVTGGDKPSLEIGVPTALFQTRIMQNFGGVFNYDVTADGKRFLIANRIDAGATPLTLVTNWNAGLKK
jgi:Tol biopolymer transport system component/tRNA A-37 threonylcarbamoyl transferase component Bud32